MNTLMLVTEIDYMILAGNGLFSSAKND